MFLVLLTYKKPMEEVEKHLAEHIAYLDKFYEQKKIIFSGRRNPRTGGLLLVKEAEKSVVEKFVEGDPFYQHEVANFEIIEFIPTKYDAGFASFVE